MSSSNPSRERPKFIWFPQWAERLQQLDLPPLIRQQHRTAIVAYLRYLKQIRQRATVNSARQFIYDVQEERRLGVSQVATWKLALRWFFQEGNKQTSYCGCESKMWISTAARLSCARVKATRIV